MRKIQQARKILAIIIIAGLLLFARTGYLLVRPGSAENLTNFVSVDNGDKDHRGKFFLVTVSQQSASPVLLLYGLINPIIDVQQRREAIPPNMDPEEYRELMQKWMQESQNLAKVIALRRHGIEVPIDSDGVEVVDVGDDSPAKEILQPGDVILSVDGREVLLAEDLVNQVQTRPIGEPVDLEILRDGQKKSVSISTTSHTEQPQKAAIRVLVQTLNWQPQLPVEIEIEVGEITGPSAGMMFVLEILNQLDAGDLTGGKQIAGTGTINLQEEVGPIGGVRQKVRASENAGAQYFLVPQENYEEAKTAARDIQLVPVTTLDEAMRFLNDIADE
ncbi:MAG: PDZ domain-containing protein [Bacillota bacterium]|nr:PDZ domain-containing protein [Bacillota bacterium]MDW7684459.1 PDZ domain-containing protein [Bacillota bacterium]